MTTDTKRRRRAKRGEPSIAIGVVRCSTSKQDIGAAAQRSELKRWATTQGVELVAIFEDIGVSGAAPLAERPALIAALQAVKDHRAGKLVAVKRDRFARHRHTIADVERAAERAGAVLVTTDGVCSGDDSDAEELASSFHDLLAAMELRKIKARNRARARQCIAEGRMHGGSVPYGYRRKPDGEIGRSGKRVELEPVPAETAVIDEIVELRRQGLSYAKVAAELRSNGITAREGRAWQPMQIKRIVDRHG